MTSGRIDLRKCISCFQAINVTTYPRKCHIWRWHAEDLKFWRKTKEFDPDKGCPYFEPNPGYSSAAEE